MEKKTNITGGNNMLSFAIIMLLAGIGIPIMAAMTSSLGKHLSSPVAASAFAFFIAFCISLLALMITDKSFVKQIPSAPKYLFVAGAFVAFYVLSISFVAPHFGIGNAIFFVLLGQLLSAAIIDHYGIFGAQINHLSTMRVSGILVMVFGVWLTQNA
jgi:transporter family-2 protein